MESSCFRPGRSTYRARARSVVVHTTITTLDRVGPSTGFDLDLYQFDAIEEFFFVSGLSVIRPVTGPGFTSKSLLNKALNHHPRLQVLG